MIKPGLGTSFATATVLVLIGFASQTEPGPSLEYPTPTIREEQQVVVGGRMEVWQLKWTSPPKPVCEPSDVSLTCPCMGFAYGEGGRLSLFRMRDGEVIDKLDLTPYFREVLSGLGQIAVVQRWEPEYDKDFQLSDQEDFIELVAKRPTAQVMQFGDYEHDGEQSQFYLQTESLPCGKSVGLVIGVSKRNPRLHALGAAAKPGKPLYMQKGEWEALRRATGPIEVLDWPCGDHGADTETRLFLRWTPKGVVGASREYSCTQDFKPGSLVHEEPL